MKIRTVTNFALGAILALSLGTGLQAQAPAPAKEAKKKMEKVAKEVAPAPTAAEISDAQAKGLVWVNLNSKKYHKDGEFFGKTKNGKFMTEDEARKAGYKPAKRD